MLNSSCEYPSCSIELPANGGARRPEKKLTVRSNEPQKNCTGLLLPMKPARNFVNTGSLRETHRQNRSTYSLSYEPCCSSCGNGIGSAISTGVVQIGTSMFASRSALIVAA